MGTQYKHTERNSKQRQTVGEGFDSCRRYQAKNKRTLVMLPTSFCWKAPILVSKSNLPDKGIRSRSSQQRLLLPVYKATRLAYTSL